MKTTVDGNKVTINDTLVIEEKGGQYTFNGNGLQFGIGTTLATKKGVEAEPEYDPYDPYRYLNGNNHLTVTESAEKAADEIEANFDQFGDQECDYGEVYEACKKLIISGKGRHTCYRLAGGIVRGRREGLYKGLPLNVVFTAMVDGKMDLDERDLGDERYGR